MVHWKVTASFKQKSDLIQHVCYNYSGCCVENGWKGVGVDKKAIAGRNDISLNCKVYIGDTKQINGFEIF